MMRVWGLDTNLLVIGTFLMFDAGEYSEFF